MKVLIKENTIGFKFDGLQLTLLCVEDLPYTLAWRNLQKEWFNSSDIIAWTDHLNWFKQYEQKNNDFVFIIQDGMGNRFGQVAIYDIDYNTKTAEFGRFIVNPASAGKGYMKKSGQAIISLCFNKLQLSALHLQVKKNNQRALRLYQSLGFTFTQETPDKIFMALNKNNNQILNQTKFCEPILKTDN